MTGGRTSVELPYGDGTLIAVLPEWPSTIIVPGDQAPVPDGRGAVASALLAPIGGPTLVEILSRHRDPRVCIVFSDITRPVPNREILPAILDQLDAVDRDRITLLCATGLHRPC